MPAAKRIKGRYEIRELLGQGGMGIVYSAFDLRVGRTVALKTLRDTPDPAALELFQRECNVLAQLSHPNIIEIFDLGQFEDEGSQKPYFVMPLLSGATLDLLIQNSGERLSVVRSVEIISQACRGLHSAHERGLVHRDLKPSNIFVLDDDSVKVIDFGVARMIESRSTIGRKGTLAYMAPEQIEMKSISALSDQFALAVLCYQTLTGRRPFEGSSDRELAHAILRHVPAPASDLNVQVNRGVSQVISKAMAKKPFHRFSNLREFSVALQRALSGETLSIFDPAAVAPRIARAQKAFDEGDLGFSAEILGELEDEGHIEQSIPSLRRRVEEAQRQNAIRALLNSAQTRFQEEEYPLALQKVHDILELDPEQPDALALKLQIEGKRTERKVEDWFRLAARHIEDRDFAHACEALRNLLELRPNDSRAKNMLGNVEQQEREYLKVRKERETLYQSALQAWQSGEITAALGKLERVLEMGSGVFSADAEACYQDSYNQVRSEYDSVQNGYAEARRYLAESNFAAAIALCDRFLAKYPQHTLFQALRIDIGETRRQKVSEEIAEINRRVAAEQDLDRRVNYLQEAASQYPDEQHFQQMLQTMRDRRELVNSIVAKARMFEEHKHFADALGQWEILQSIHPQYPGIEYEFERVKRRREQQVRSESKARWVEQIDRDLGAGRVEAAMASLAEALTEFPQDAELTQLQKLASNKQEWASEAQDLLRQGTELCASGRPDEGIGHLRRAVERSPRDAEMRAVLVEWLIRHGYEQLERDLEAAESLAQQALDLDPTQAPARSLLTLARDRQAEQFVSNAVIRARELQLEARYRDALNLLDDGLKRYPDDSRLRHLREMLAKAWDEARQRDLAEAKRLERDAVRAADAETRQSLLAQARALAAGHAEHNEDVRNDVEADRKRLYAADSESFEQPSYASGPPFVARSANRLETATVSVQARKRGSYAHLFPFDIFRRWIWAVPGIAILALLIGLSIRNGAEPEKNIRTKSRAGTKVPPPQLTPAVEVRPASTSRPLQLLTDAASAEIRIDGQIAEGFSNGALDLGSLSAGRHTVAVTTSRGEAEFVVEVPADGTELKMRPTGARNAISFVAMAQSGNTRIVSSAPGSRVSIDGGRAVSVGAKGLHLLSLTPGEHKITVGSPERRTAFSINVGEQPAATAFVHTPPPRGSLVVMTGEDGTLVSLNGHTVDGLTQQGQIRFESLIAREYLVEVSKPGFEPPPPRRVRVLEGRQAATQFQMKPLTASVELSGVPPGTNVVLNSKPAGIVQENGRLTIRGVQPGNHVLELRKDRYKAKQIPVKLSPGETVRLGEEVTALAAVEQTAIVKFRIKPQSSKLTVTVGNKPPEPVNPNNPLSLPRGEYSFTAEATGYESRVENVKLNGGETREINITLNPKVMPPKPVEGATAWEKPERWTREGDTDILQGGDIVLLRRDTVQGTITFAAKMLKGKRLQWVINYQDSKNYCLFQMDKKHFRRILVKDGDRTELAKIVHGSQIDEGVELQVTIEPHSILHRVRNGTRWRFLDQWSDRARTFSEGRFGFVAPGRDRIALIKFLM